MEDIKDAVRRVTEAGGKVLGEPMEIPDVGYYVSFTDTEGNRGSIRSVDPAQADEEARHQRAGGGIWASIDT